MITHLHHINFLVRDLDQAVTKYQTLLGKETGKFRYDELESRGVKIARIKLGTTWLVLVQPIGDEGIPAQHLKKHGEGFFLLSLGCDNLDQEIARITADAELEFTGPKRQGLDTWQVRDLAIDAFSGVQIQLTQDDVNHGTVSQE